MTNILFKVANVLASLAQLFYNTNFKLEKTKTKIVV